MLQFIYIKIMPYTSHREVFTLAAKVAKELREKNPKLGVPESTKLAWQDPRVLAAKKEAAAYRKKTGGTEGGGSTPRRPRTGSSKPKSRATTGSRKVSVRK